MGIFDYMLEKVRGRKKDINLPNEKPITPVRQRAFEQERADDDIKKLKDMSNRVKGLFPAGKK